MKFLCDRCKTRYSIGDERVRGKILKIRCKNCANVITVREGMTPDPEPLPEPQARAKKSTTAAPGALSDSEAAQAAQPAQRPRGAAQAEPGRRGPLPSLVRAESPPSGARPVAAAKRQTASGMRSVPDAEPRCAEIDALGAAFASEMTKPPPALDEEWYVSIDGEQEGPYSLAEAQQWVGQQPFDADLYCWSEGFDDWLPVDKVSHFRGLRKRLPPPAMPPPVPRTIIPPRAAAAAVTPVQVRVEDEPKALFAATMASLERSPPPSALGLPSVTKPARATPPLGTAIAPRTNGVTAPPLSAKADKPSLGRATPADDPSVSDASDSQTQIEPMPFRELSEEPTRPPAMPPSAPDVAESATLIGTAATPAAAGESDTASSVDVAGDAEHDLAIGEVSRVVKLADIVRRGRAAERSAAERSAAMRRSGQLPLVGRSTGMSPSLRGTGALPLAGAAPDGTPGAPDGDPALAMAPIATSHRRGLIALLSVAALLVLGVIGAVVLLVTTNQEPTPGKLGPVRDIDTSRPEDPITHRPIDPAKRPPGSNAFVPVRPPPHRVNPGPTSPEPEAPAGNALRPDEIEDIARKYQDATQRCYMRAQRGADAILVGDVKKIGVTLTIDGDGSVSEVGLSEHGGDNLGKCLIGLMRGWRFRSSPGGQFRFSLNFVGS